jgi:hypothetical protein
MNSRTQSPDFGGNRVGFMENIGGHSCSKFVKQVKITSHIINEHHIFTDMNFTSFLPLFSLSADVDFWVNGGWDQPKCGITVNPLFFLQNNQNTNNGGKNCNAELS